MARFRTPALIAASTHTGRCGPCCSVAPTGSSAMTLSLSSRSNSFVVISDQFLLGSVPTVDDSDDADDEAARRWRAGRELRWNA